MMRKPAKAGRYKDDVCGVVEVNSTTGRARIKWFFWGRLYDYETKTHGDWEWVYNTMGRLVGGYDTGPRVYHVESFRNIRRALKRYHKVMAAADLIAFGKMEHERAEREDWVLL